MDDTRTALATRLQSAFDALEVGADPVLRPSDHADFQANGTLALGKRLGRPPREVAEEIVARAELDDLCETVEVSGPAFITLTLSAAFIEAQTAAVSGDERLGNAVAARPETVVVDY